MTEFESVSTNSVPALARTDVRPPEPAPADPRRRGITRLLAIGAAVLVAVAVLVFGLVFALRHEMVDPALVGAQLLEGWR